MLVILREKYRDTSVKTFIIAEAGVNHNGSLEQALKLVDAAVNAGADAVKFQTFKAENIVSKTLQQADYQTKNTGKQQSQYQLLKQLELSEQDHQTIIDYCQHQKIEFMSTPFDDDSIQLLADLNMTRWKIPSGELLSIPYLRKIARLNQPTILSTGMASVEEIELAVNTLFTAGLSKNNLTILHANTAYPTPFKDVNLRAMITLKDRFQVNVGLSDHSLGIEVPIAAVAMGAMMIEKHFTLDTNLSGPDHKASLNPQQLTAMIQSIRNVEQAMGDGRKQATDSEVANKTLVRKRIIAKCSIQKGEVFNEQNITLKRAEQGEQAVNWDRVIGTKAIQSFVEDEGVYL